EVPQGPAGGDEPGFGPGPGGRALFARRPVEVEIPVAARRRGSRGCQVPSLDARRLDGETVHRRRLRGLPTRVTVAPSPFDRAASEPLIATLGRTRSLRRRYLGKKLVRRRAGPGRVGHPWRPPP